jgi:hypothetical protein
VKVRLMTPFLNTINCPFLLVTYFKQIGKD